MQAREPCPILVGEAAFDWRRFADLVSRAAAGRVTRSASPDRRKADDPFQAADQGGLFAGSRVR
ncbi:MAG: hypothetical protein C3F11_08675 [Methylocystaceae bacterium]|nr:MAG: hypothetical protein C3F11_08675 [Methylocystaceae bacterium]